MSDGGKGSAPRPYSVDTEIFFSNFERIFGKKKNDSHNNGSAGNNREEESNESGKGTGSNADTVSSS